MIAAIAQWSVQHSILKQKLYLNRAGKDTVEMPSETPSGFNIYCCGLYKALIGSVTDVIYRVVLRVHCSLQHLVQLHRAEHGLNGHYFN